MNVKNISRLSFVTFLSRKKSKETCPLRAQTPYFLRTNATPSAPGPECVPITLPSATE